MSGSGGANGYWAPGVKIGGTQYEVNGDVNKGRILKTTGYISQL